MSSDNSYLKKANLKGECNKWMMGIEGLEHKYDSISFRNAELLENSIRTDPAKGLQSIAEVFIGTINEAYDGNTIADIMCRNDPHESLTRPIINAVGNVYPELSRKEKDIAIEQIISVFDGMRYDKVNGVTCPGVMPGVREPLLVADVSLVSWFYWPGIEEGQKLAKVYPNFAEMEINLIDSNGMFYPNKVEGDFSVGYGFLRSDTTNYGEHYAKVANPFFLERLMKGIVAVRFGDTKDGDEIKKGDARLRELLPECLHDRIEPLRQEHDWVDPKKIARR